MIHKAHKRSPENVITIHSVISEEGGKWNYSIFWLIVIMKINIKSVYHTISMLRMLLQRKETTNIFIVIISILFLAVKHLYYEGSGKLLLFGK